MEDMRTSLTTAADLPVAPAQPVSFGTALRFWLKLGFVNFGGPAGQIALMHKELVDEKRWVSEAQFLRALNFCTLLPGPEAQQLATYIGWRLHGVRGGLVAGLLFIAPSIVVMLLLSWLTAAYGAVPLVRGLFYGIQPVVIAIVLEAVLRIGRRTLTHPVLLAFAALAFVTLAILRLPFPFVVFAAGFAAWMLQRWYPQVFTPRGHTTTGSTALRDDIPLLALPTWRRNMTIIGIFLALWIIPVGSVAIWRGGDDVLTRLALFFTQAAFVTFGGAYAVLSYIADVAVNHYGWLSAEQMIKGLALAESTPGPLIMVTQYVGFLAAYRLHGAYPPTLYGILGALITTYTTFLPCFLFVFLGAPYIEALSHHRQLQAALVGITAAVVGVILNLAVFFAIHVLFPSTVGFQGLDGLALILATGAFLLLQRIKLPVYWVIALGGVIGIIWTVLQ